MLCIALVPHGLQNGPIQPNGPILIALHYVDVMGLNVTQQRSKQTKIVVGVDLHGIGRKVAAIAQFFDQKRAIKMIEHCLQGFRFGTVYVVASVIPQVVGNAVLRIMKEVIFKLLFGQVFFQQFGPVTHQLKLIAVKGGFQSVQIFLERLLFNVIDRQKAVKQLFEVRHDIVELLFVKGALGK